MKLFTTLACLAALAGPVLALENGDPFSTGDSFGPRAGDFSLNNSEAGLPREPRLEIVPSPAQGGRVGAKCHNDIQAPGVWMECAPAWRIDR